MASESCPFCLRLSPRKATELDWGFWAVVPSDAHTGVQLACGDCAYYAGAYGLTEQNIILLCAGEDPLRPMPTLDKNFDVATSTVLCLHKNTTLWPYVTIRA